MCPSSWSPKPAMPVAETHHVRVSAAQLPQLRFLLPTATRYARLQRSHATLYLLRSSEASLNSGDPPNQQMTAQCQDLFLLRQPDSKASCSLCHPNPSAQSRMPSHPCPAA
ncbi:hypothetical protein GUJ93_ZPchr0001g30786 [Zizania palustris]|uniref:Uncharacterized protein n=1 Tax=Zizania palustris TaxID=103762 RepID=A0A8J5V745_ZIZPA|nr:hypothetical protein GUJ93_ZPchr0001g30786 [Zizania palustris]